MAEIGSKSFATEMVKATTSAVENRLGDYAYIRRYLGNVSAIDTTAQTCSVKILGSATASTGFSVRGIQFPNVGDDVSVCIAGQERWVESVLRPKAATTPYLYVGGSDIIRTDDLIRADSHAAGAYSAGGSSTSTTITTHGTYYAMTSNEVSFTPAYVGQRFLLLASGYGSLNGTTAQYVLIRGDVTDNSNAQVSLIGYGRFEASTSAQRGGTFAIMGYWTADAVAARKWKLFATTEASDSITLFSNYTRMTVLPLI